MNEWNQLGYCIWNPDGSGDEDLLSTTTTNHHQNSANGLLNQRGGSNASLNLDQQDTEHPSSNLWGNSSRYINWFFFLIRAETLTKEASQRYINWLSTLKAIFNFLPRIVTVVFIKFHQNLVLHFQFSSSLFSHIHINISNYICMGGFSFGNQIEYTSFFFWN